MAAKYIEKRKNDFIVRKFLKAIELYGHKSFQKISEYVGTRTIKQCRSHMQKHLIKINKQQIGGG